MEEATHVAVNGVVYKIAGNICTYNVGLRWVEEDVWIPIELFPILGIKPLRERKQEPIVFEFIPSIEMAKDMWLPADFIVPMEAVGKKFKCVEILEDDHE